MGPFDAYMMYSLLPFSIFVTIPGCHSLLFGVLDITCVPNGSLCFVLVGWP